MNQHPPAFVKPSDRFVVMLQVGMMTKGMGMAFEALAYGLPGQPAPDQLLRRGARATSFPSEAAAQAAAKDSAKKWNRDGLTFHRGSLVSFLKVEEAQ